MTRYLKLYLVAFAVFLAIDLVWLVLVAQTFYQQQIGFLLSPNTNWAAAIAFYLLFVVGILVFCVVPGLRQPAWYWVALRGALFGLITYATYDLTNLATIKDWPIVLTLVDLTWGTILSMVVSIAAWKIGQRIH